MHGKLDDGLVQAEEMEAKQLEAEDALEMVEAVQDISRGEGWPD